MTACCSSICGKIQNTYQKLTDTVSKYVDINTRLAAKEGDSTVCKVIKSVTKFFSAIVLGLCVAAPVYVYNLVTTRSVVVKPTEPVVSAVPDA
jgi:hypothetical protein